MLNSMESSISIKVFEQVLGPKFQFLVLFWERKETDQTFYKVRGVSLSPQKLV